MIFTDDFFTDVSTLIDKRVLIVSGADTKYYNLLMDMLASLKQVDPLPNMDIACFDLGLEDWQRDTINKQGITLKYPEDLDNIFPKGTKKSPASLASLGKITLPKQFPGYDIYMWVDADIWFQTQISVQLPVLMASQGKMAIVPQIDRTFLKFNEKKISQKQTNIFLRYLGIKKRPYSFWRDIRVKQALNNAQNSEAVIYYHVNGGLFAISEKAPHWKAWLDCYRNALRKGPLVSGIAQTCISYLWLENKLSFHPLPATFNWVCHLAKPVWNEQKSFYMTPLEPHEVIHAIHLTLSTNKLRNSNEFRYSKIPNHDSHKEK